MASLREDRPHHSHSDPRKSCGRARAPSDALRRINEFTSAALWRSLAACYCGRRTRRCSFCGTSGYRTYSLSLLHQPCPHRDQCCTHRRRAAAHHRRHHHPHQLQQQRRRKRWPKQPPAKGKRIQSTTVRSWCLALGQGPPCQRPWQSAAPCAARHEGAMCGLRARTRGAAINVG